MISEMRSERQELDNRRHFTPEKKSIELIRGLLAEWTEIPEPVDPDIIAAQTASTLKQASQDDLIEVG